MRLLVILVLSTVPLLAQVSYMPTLMGTWEPRNLVTKAGIVASYDPGNIGANVSNPAGWAAGNSVSALSNRVTLGTADLLQGTAANQPLLSRADNKGNILLQSEAFNTTWTLSGNNAFGATDTGAAGAGSFANTARTIDPLGGNTADYVQESSGGTLHILVSGALNLPLTEYIFSVFLKGDGQTNVMLHSYGAGKGKGFNLSNGTALNVSGEAAPTSYGIVTDVGWNGFYLCWIQYTLPVVAESVRVYSVTNSAGTYTYSYAGDNTKGFFAWGASLTPSTWTPVTGPTAALGYIPTTTVPIYSGLGGRQVAYFDGSAYRLATAAFTLNQPTSIYGLFNHFSWTLSDAVFDGNGLASGKFYESSATPKLRGNAGTDMTEFVPPPLGTWQVDNVVFDGASSRISTNSGAFVVSDANTSNMGGFTLGSAATAGTTYWNGLCGRVLICNKTNSAAEDGYLRWGLLKQASLY